jgi:PAS domain S-box-containing protein
MKHIRKLISILSNHDMTALQITILSAGISVAVLGILALAGLALHISWLSSLGSGLIPMAPSTALFFILFGISITFNAKNFFFKKLYLPTIIAIVTSVILSFTIFILSFFNIHIPFEHLWFTVSGSVDGAPIGYMSPVTALFFVFSGASLLMTFTFISYNVWRSIASFCLSGFVLFVSFTFFLAYIFGAPLMYGSAFIPPALNTIIAFMILGIINSILTGKYINENNYRLKKTLLSSSILLIIFIFCIIAITTIGFGYYRSYEKQYRATIEKQLLAVAELKVGQLLRWRKERLDNAAIFYRNKVFSGLIKHLLDNPADAYTRNKLASWLNPVLSSFEYNRICFHDASGYERFSNPDININTPLVFKERSSEALKTGSIIFQDFYRDEYDQRVYLNTFIPIFDEYDANKILGVLSLRIDPSKYLYAFIESWPTPSTTAETILVKREGENAVFLNELRFQKNTALNLKVALNRKDSPAVQAALGYKGIFEGIDYNGKPVIADICAIPDSPWHLVARMDTSEVYAPLRDRMRLIIVLIIALLVGSGASVGLIWRQQQNRFYETQLLAEKERNWLQDIIARSLNEIYVYDPVTLMFKFVNTGAQNNLEYSMPELKEKSILDIESEFTEDAYQKTIQPLISEEKKVLVFETNHQRKDGTTYPVDVHLQLVDMQNGDVFLAIINDITERKHAEENIIASETRYRRLFESAKDGILILDAESGKVADVNPYLVEMLGFSHDAFLGKYIWDIGIFKDIISNKNNLATLLEKEYIRYENLPLQTVDGAIIDVEFVSNVYLVNHQKVIQCNIRNITDRVKTETELRIKNQVFEDSIASQNTANLKGELLHVNPAMLQMWGYRNADEIIGKSVASLFVNPEDAVPVFEALNTAGKWNGEFNAKRADGSTFISRGYATCMKNTKGEITGYQSANLDVTKERQADAQILQTSADLARSNRDLEQFANVASHDLQEPLRMVASYTQLLAERYKDQLDEKANKYIHYAVDGAVRMQQLINDLLIYSRVGTQGKKPEQVDSHHILGEALVNLTASIQNSHAIITNDNLPVVYVDATQLLQVFQNLISNAVKFKRDENPIIHISAEDRNTEWLFSVRDNGIGIDAHHTEKLFVIFQRLHTRDEYPGTGIGLALCKRIIDRHGGKIWFESVPGQGSIFYFTLPK